MKITIQTGLRTTLCMAVLAATMGCAEKTAVMRSETLAASEAASQPIAVAEPTEPKAILMRMAEFLAKTQKFSVKLSSSYDVLQESGQMVEFGEKRRITVSRPNGLRVKIKHSDGEQHLVQYDGNEITTFSPTHNVYAQVSKPGGIDDAIMYFLKDLGMRLPLAILLTSRFPEELDRRTQAIDYIEKTVINGKPVHHLAGRTETVDYQIWIKQGAKPLPLRIVLNYKNAEGHPGYRAQFSEWNLKPEIQGSQFTFNPAEGVRKIAFAAELNKIALEGLARPEQTGGKQ